MTTLLLALVCAQDPMVDLFERHLLGPGWTVLGNAGVGIVNDSDLGTLNTGGCAVGWTGSTFRADGFSEAETATDIDPNMLTQVFVRHRTTDRARYGFHFNGDPGRSQWEIKYDGVPSAQTRILASLPAAPPVPGDRIRIEVEGSDPVRLRGFHRDRLVLSAVDAEPQRIVAAGMTGVVARMRQGTMNTPPTPIFESWAGGSLAWYGLGNALPGTGGPPALAGSGFLVGGSPVLLALSNAIAGAPAILVAGLSRIDQPFLGGVLVPRPDAVLPGLLVDGQGRLSLPLVWPAGLPSGFTVFAQFWIADPVGPQGVAASNGLLALVP